MNKTMPEVGTSGKKRLRELQSQTDNRVCADCSAPDPKWAAVQASIATYGTDSSVGNNLSGNWEKVVYIIPSETPQCEKFRSTSIGVFICLKCCGVHRGLGTHISKVLSVTLDEWSEDEIAAMIEVGGNASANSIYEAYIPEGYSKPGPDSSHEERAKFIRSKYELQDFLKPSLRINSNPKKKSSLQESFSKRLINSFRSSSSSKKTEGMVEFIGMLKVKVLNGTNLAIRDMLSSDPYVILMLGQQKVQTTVRRSNLNPVWNEELMLSVPQDFGSLKVQVYDYDTFSADDIMGEAEVDIQPMITSAMAFGDAGMFGNMQIGKWLKSDDNALLEDSTVHILDGKVQQSMSLKLQNVESGELYLDLEWMPLDQ